MQQNLDRRYISSLEQLLPNGGRVVPPCIEIAGYRGGGRVLAPPGVEIEGYGGEGANMTKYISLVESDGLVHGRLDMQRLDVLPIFLQERNEEINTLKDDSQCSSIDPALYSTHST